MIHQANTTYTRFQRPAEYPQRKEPVVGETGEAGETKPKKPLRVHPHQALYSETTSHMNDLVERLNGKAYLFQNPVSFEVRSVKHRPHILMMGGENVLNRFESAEDLIELERSLHDMAGFRFSVVG